MVTTDELNDRVNSMLITDQAKEDYFPDATGDAPRGNRLGGGGDDMAGSGTWAKNELDDVTPNRPDTLELEKNAQKTVISSPISDSTLSPMEHQRDDLDDQINTQSYLLEEPSSFSYEQFTGKF